MISRNARRRRRVALAVCLLTAAGMIASCNCPQKAPTVVSDCPKPIPIPGDHDRLKERSKAFRLTGFRVESGREDSAKRYYREVVSPQLGFLTPETIEASSIKDLLEYFGYSDITAQDLHRQSSKELMALHEPGDILATRFFAPKITAVAAEPTQIPASGFGWRKLIRLKAKAGSRAADNGISMLFFLQSVFEKTVEGDPFAVDKNVSCFNQAMVVRTKPPFDDKDKHAVYFLTYGPLVPAGGQCGGGDSQGGGRIIFSLIAAFADRDPETGLGPKDYWVPDSCLQCHGGSPALAKANYLDTDHWFDRVTPDYGLTDPKYKQEDFTALAGSTQGVLYDGGKELNKPQFHSAFGVVRIINEEIRDQNRLLGEDAANFQLAAVNKWLSLHPPGAAGAVHVPPYKRSFGSPAWEADNESHRKLLYYFNRYCYRCHSSVEYNVFDLEAVKTLRGLMRKMLLEIKDPRTWMPQDRIFPGLATSGGVGVATEDLKEFLDLLGGLQ